MDTLRGLRIVLSWGNLADDEYEAVEKGIAEIETLRERCDTQAEFIEKAMNDSARDHETVEALRERIETLQAEVERLRRQLVMR